MSTPSSRMSGGPVNAVQSTRHSQLLEQYSEYLPITERLQSELLETIDQLRDLPRPVKDGDDELIGGSSKWDEDTVRGLKTWAQDLGVSWRALRRSRFRQDKASELLLETLTVRTSPPLHTPLPLHLQTYIFQNTTEPIFAILPPTSYTDRVGRPIAVLSLRHIKRNIPARNGEMGKEGIREFAWWIAELTRRVMRDWYTGEFDAVLSKDDIAGGGCVLVVDAKDAGIKNLELELLPYLISINHNHFPSQFSTVYVLNHSWTHSGLWACIKRILPQTALEKIVFLKGDQEIGDIFDLERFPRVYGGQVDRDLREDAFWLYNTYGKNPISTASSIHSSTVEGKSVPEDPTKTHHASVAAVPALYVPSYESIADVFYSARNTPMHSTRASPVLNPKIGKQRRRALRLDLAMTSRPPAGIAFGFVPLKGPDGVVLGQVLSSKEGPSTTRVRSISDFQLYLSPSRVTNLDLLLSSDEEASDEESLQLESLRARQKARRESRSSLRFDASSSSVSTRHYSAHLPSETAAIDGSEKSGTGKATRPAITPWISGSGRAADSMRQASWDEARSYSASLIRHHAQGLTRNKRTSGLSTEVTTALEAGEQAHRHDREEHDPPETRSLGSTTARDNDSDVHSSTQPTVSDESDSTHTHRRRIELPISAYDRMMNPMFGYPVIQTVSTSGTNLAGMLRPRYGRKRKRDLAKTLVFLFLLRLDSFRRWIGQASTHFAGLLFTMIGLGGWFKSRSQAEELRGQAYGATGVKTSGRRNPEQAFTLARHSYALQGLDAMNSRELAAAKGDWLWMVITIVLVRGSWGRLLLSTLEELRRVRRVFNTNVR
ncbi:hypothetical protein QFC22_000206 [Naganishia vaughanmartiniae]|uniref:Uncharacterized protein n=1 Tax=Naganishia vaughanmartiniae TaxID=1424756 RepID=A0ACC2XPG9_9TREE|nr:hypothetical protein QFC22_000206 [Naganishia vaughanmartiniae]